MCLIFACMLIIVVFYILGAMTNHDGMILVGIICVLIFLMIYFFLGKIFDNKGK